MDLPDIIENNYKNIFIILLVILVIIVSMMIAIRTLTNIKKKTTIKNQEELSYSDFPEPSSEQLKLSSPTEPFISKKPSSIKNKKGEKFVDENREFKDMMTDLVVNEFFDEEGLYNFLSDIIIDHNEAIEKYKSKNGLNPKDIMFLFKGGNVLRMVGNEFLYQLPSSVAERLKSKYKPFFKRSDADFGIYVNPEVLKKIPKIYDEMAELTYEVQYHLREKFSLDPTRYFKFMKLSRSMQSKILNNYLSKLQNANSLTTENSKWKNVKINKLMFDTISSDGNYSSNYQPINDKLITFGKNEDSIIIAPKFYLGEIVQPHPLYINDNRALKFCKEENCDVPINFDLVRTKINFSFDTSNGVKSIGGELIDVSIGKDVSIKHFYENVNENIEEYTLNLNDNSLTFTSYSIKYLAEDIYRIIYKDTNYKPWTDAKYKKRLSRYLFLGFVDEFMKKRSIGEMRSQLISMKDDISHDGKSAILNSQILNDLLDASHTVRQDEDKNEVNDYLESIVSEINELLSSLTGLENYINSQGQITTDQLSSIDSDKLI